MGLSNVTCLLVERLMFEGFFILIGVGVGGVMVGVGGDMMVIFFLFDCLFIVGFFFFVSGSVEVKFGEVVGVFVIVFGLVFVFGKFIIGCFVKIEFFGFDGNGFFIFIVCFIVIFVGFDFIIFFVVVGVVFFSASLKKLFFFNMFFFCGDFGDVGVFLFDFNVLIFFVICFVYNIVV